MTQTAGIGSVAYPTPNLWETHRELIDAYYELRRAIDVVEKTIDDLDPESRGGTPGAPGRARRPTRRAVRRPVLNLALMLLEQNRREWLHAKPDTNGAQAVERHRPHGEPAQVDQRVRRRVRGRPMSDTESDTAGKPGTLSLRGRDGRGQSVSTGATAPTRGSSSFASPGRSASTPTRSPTGRSLRGLGGVRRQRNGRDPLCPLDGNDDVIARLEDVGLEGHREVATELFTRDDVRPLVGALPHFDVLGPTEQGDSGDTTESTRRRHVE